MPYNILEGSVLVIHFFNHATEQLYQSATVSPQLLELRNMITIGYLIVKCASFQKESSGLHYNTDYAGKQPMAQNIVL